MKRKKTVITIISAIAVLLVIIGVTYAYWLVTKTQTNQNVISTGCLDITLNGEKNDITLTEQFPMSDTDGMKLVPYEFTVTNNCTTSVDYHINLESIGDSSNAIKASAIKVALNDDIKLLTSGGNFEPTVSGAYESNRILFGTLAGSSEETTDDSVTYELRIWIDEDAPISEQNKTFRSKISVTVGHGVINPYKEGTLAYDILSNYEGADAITSLSAEWTEGDASTVTASSTSVGTSNNYWYGTTYKFDKETGKYTLSGTLTQATLTECRNGTKTCGKYTLQNPDKEYSYQTIYEVTAFGTSGNNVTAKILKSSNDFSSATKASDAGIYKMPDDLGESYYFRGAPTNNYVKFGSYASGSTVNDVTYSEEMPMYWRIVRINGDGTIRLVYDGTAPVANGITHTATIADAIYNTGYYNSKYVGYTYDDGNGIQVDSIIKGVVDNWYEDNLEETYGKYIADGIFCNDRKKSIERYWDEHYNEITEPISSGWSEVYFNSYTRIVRNIAPKLTCTNKNDRYTKSEGEGNGLLDKPIGLLTADEVLMAGGVVTNTSHYLYSNEAFWTSSPSYLLDIGDFDDGMYMYYVSANGSISNYDAKIGDSRGVRPVINLKADVKFTGNGRIDTNTPYEIVME